MKSILKILLVSLFIVSLSAAQFSEDALRYSTRGTGVGSRALGMGNAYIGVSDDYSASIWNPAGLAQLRRLEFTGGVSNFGLTNDATYLGTKATENVTATSLDDVGFVFPFPTVQGSLVFSFGYNRIADYASAHSFDGYNNQSSIIPTLYDSDVAFDVPFNVYLTNSDGYTSVQDSVQQRGLIKEGGNLGQWSFAGAIDVEENISFGVSLNIMTGSYEYARNYVEEDINNVYNNAQANLPVDSAYLRFNKFYHDRYINSEISGGGFTFGMMYRSDRYRVGIIAKTPTSVTIRETYSDAGESVFDPSGTWQGGPPPVTKHEFEATNEYGVSSPWTLGVGASFYIIPEFLIAADIENTDWTQMEFTDNSVLEKENPTLQKEFRAVTSYRLGAEIDVPSTDIRLRGGYSLTPSPYKNDPSSFDQTVYSAGAGIFLQRNVVLDAAVAFGSHKSFRNQYTFRGIVNASRTDESISTTTLNITLSYRF
ncbi:MAG: outer membrane protein transport protein [Ignavibacteriales bacterium]|nr:outer membrane protein transport protein [Ignavibacteriales bacterium]